jgi:AraC-like DNA-binding protein
MSFPKIMALITVLTRNRALVQATALTLREHHALLPVATWTRLNWALRERPVTCAVIDGSALKRSDPEEELLDLSRRYPSVGLVLVAGEALPAGLLFRLGRAGVSGLVLLPVDGMARDLPAAVRKSLVRSTASLVTRVVSPSLPRRETEALRWALEAPQRGWSTEEVAARLGFTRPHASVRLDARGLPSLGHLVLWSRMLHAGRWVGEPGRSAESVSRQLGYANGSAFRRALRNYVGGTPTEVAEGGGLGLVLERFVDACDLLIQPRAMSSVA